MDAALVRVLIRYVFIRVVAERETCHIYEKVLQTIKIAAHNLSGVQAALVAHHGRCVMPYREDDVVSVRCRCRSAATMT
jgi:hypothetical protein